MNHTTLAQF